MRMLCVARHQFLSEHLCRYFEALGMDAVPCVGLAEAKQMVPKTDLDVVVCDYDLLVSRPLASWESDPATSSVPLVAVSLTRHPGDAHLMDVNGIAGFLYLPTLSAEDAGRILAGVRRTRGISPPNGLAWPGHTPAPLPR
jgi:hypothetical protein